MWKNSKKKLKLVTCENWTFMHCRKSRRNERGRGKKSEPNETTKEEESTRRKKNNRKLNVIFVSSIFARRLEAELCNVLLLQI